jgi:hypothetical protein
MQQRYPRVRIKSFRTVHFGGAAARLEDRLAVFATASVIAVLSAASF